MSKPAVNLKFNNQFNCQESIDRKKKLIQDFDDNTQNDTTLKTNHLNFDRCAFDNCTFNITKCDCSKENKP